MSLCGCASGDDSLIFEEPSKESILGLVGQVTSSLRKPPGSQADCKFKGEDLQLASQFINRDVLVTKAWQWTEGSEHVAHVKLVARGKPTIYFDLSVWLVDGRCGSFELFEVVE